MADQGEWTEADYRFEIKSLANKAVKEDINIRKFETEIMEINLKTDNLTLSIEKSKQNKEKHLLASKWCEDKLKEKQND